MISESDQLVVALLASGQAGVGRGFGGVPWKSPTGIGDANGTGKKTIGTGVGVVVGAGVGVPGVGVGVTTGAAFQSNPLPIRSILL